jgi:hypothetical protein
MTSHTTAAPSTAASTTKSRALAVGAATVAALLVWALGKAFGADYEVVQGEGKDPMEVNVGLVAVFALISALLGWGLLAALEKFVPAKAATIWGVVATVVLLASYGMVFSADTRIIGIACSLSISRNRTSSCPLLGITLNVMVMIGMTDPTGAIMVTIGDLMGRLGGERPFMID